MKSRLSGLSVSLRKYHRLLALIVCLPVTLTVITGMLATIAGEWTFMDIGISRSLILSIHTGEIFKFQAFYPILNGLGLIGLLITGLSMSGLFRQRSKKAKASDKNSDKTPD
jgi:hypothetical protein